MQKTKMVQAAGILLLAAMGTGCAASKAYTSKLFSPRAAPVKDSSVAVLRFLDIENEQTEKTGWVSTDIITGRDTISKTLALDKLAGIYPAAAGAKDSLQLKPGGKASGEITTKPAVSEPVAKYLNPGEVRTKKVRE